MKCIVNGCDRDARYKSDQLCQKHYFRKWRYGTTELTVVGKGKEKYLDSQGYVLMIQKDHPLAGKGGLIREHRVVAYTKYKDEPLKCTGCACELNWSTAHVDHINNNKQDNTEENLRLLCRGCNVMRTHTKKPRHKSKGNSAITFEGLTLTAAEWSRFEGVTVVGNTINNRLKNGWSVRDALFLPSKTHPNTKVKTSPTKYKNIHEPNAKGMELD